MSEYSPREIAIGLCSRREFPFWFVRTVAEGVWTEPEEEWLKTFLRVSEGIAETQQQLEWKRVRKLREHYQSTFSLQELAAAGKKELMKSRKKEIYINTFFDPDYPPDFRALEEPPSVLWSTQPLGRFFASERLSVIGSRKLTYYGERATKIFVKQLAGAYKLTIVSGCAQGADWYAHQTALAEGGKTVGFLGSGIEQMLPRYKLLTRSKGAILISEFPPQAPSDKWRFPFRNRLIAAAGKGVFIVEAGENSGTLITAAAATKIGKEVMVLTQPWDSPNAVVFRKLSRDGARVIVKVEDILDQLGLPHVATRKGINLTAILASAQNLVERAFLQELIRRGGNAFFTEMKKPAKIDDFSWEEAQLNLEARGIIRQRLGACELAGMLQS